MGRIMEGRTEVVGITMTPELKDIVRQRAFEARLSVSTYLYQILERFFLSYAVENPTESNGHATIGKGMGNEQA